MTSTHHARRHPRARLDMYASLVHQGEPHLIRLKNLSQSGVYFWTVLDPAVYRRAVTVQLDLPAYPEPILATGHALRLEESGGHQGVALEFISISKNQQAALDEFVQTERGIGAVH